MLCKFHNMHVSKLLFLHILSIFEVKIFVIICNVLFRITTQCFFKFAFIFNSSSLNSVSLNCAHTLHTFMDRYTVSGTVVYNPAILVVWYISPLNNNSVVTGPYIKFTNEGNYIRFIAQIKSGF